MPTKIEIIKNEKWFKIEHYDTLRPFFMNVVSDSNHWMFISSNGGLTAGRKNNKFSLFPYYTDDKITESADITGSKSIFQIRTTEGLSIWEPFSERFTGKYKISRNLFKNFFGNKIMFEETNHDLGLTYRYQWNSSNLYGFVRKSELINNLDNSIEVNLLDGIQNIVPYGVEPDLQNAASNLVDAYKRNELVIGTGLGIYALSAIIVDKAEPSEALKANIAFSLGFENPTYLLSSLQLKAFRNGHTVAQEDDIKGEKGAYFVNSTVVLKSKEIKEWKIIANVNQNHSSIIYLNRELKQNKEFETKIEEDIQLGSKKLKKLVSGADGLRRSQDYFKDARHFSNVLFNIMRGGTFDNNFQIEKRDFSNYLKSANVDLYNQISTLLENIDDESDNHTLYQKIESINNPDLIRLGKEYLPLKFSRRHGDPSRPWNQFSINTHSEVDGSKILDYEGNWRDIFQNWEALVHSYPGFIEGMIFKFLNNSTFDGYNPYRVTKGGFDWETIEPDNPWSYIGYWGDHQIIYLLKFLEFYQAHDSKALANLFNREIFVYANVPYRIASYNEITRDPKNTISFDEASDHQIRASVSEKGADGALLTNQKGEIHRASFIEKILATLLAKISNFIPEGGIWLNTQRPEWNDANNALVGNGVSMVTLYYLRRFLKFFEEVTKKSTDHKVVVSKEIKALFSKVTMVLSSNTGLLSGSINDQQRKLITDALGTAASDFRYQIYQNGFSGDKENILVNEILSFIEISLKYLEHSIEANRRADKLFHSYNLMSYSDEGITLSHLSEMLEGQVAVLSSGYLSAGESVEVLDALRNSALYRKDQNSYILYPNKNLPGFLQKNNIPQASVNSSELLKKLVYNYDHRIIIQDIEGGYHFNGNFRNVNDLKDELNSLKTTEYGLLIEKEYDRILKIFEEVFNHKAFTGRSGTFFAYEGLGSIYWHMVSKLYLAVCEVCRKVAYESQDKLIIKRLFNHFYEIGDGIGIHKKPEIYGAFPTDAYSHTPCHRGAQQPGMTGQVKEDILVHLGEVGVSVDNGILRFNPFLLRKDEFTKEEKSLGFIHLNQEREEIMIPPNALCFSYCQVPIIYKLSNQNSITVSFNESAAKTFSGLTLDAELSKQLFRRTGFIKSITVTLEESLLN